MRFIAQECFWHRNLICHSVKHRCGLLNVAFRKVHQCSTCIFYLKPEIMKKIIAIAFSAVSLTACNDNKTNNAITNSDTTATTTTNATTPADTSKINTNLDTARTTTRTATTTTT